METLVARCAGLDVHKCSVTACVRVPDGHSGRYAETRRFTTTTADLYVVAEWLASQLPGDPGGDGVHRVLLKPMRPGLASWSSTAGQSHTRRNLRKAGRNVPFDPLCAATSYAPAKRTACRDTQ